MRMVYALSEVASYAATRYAGVTQPVWLLSCAMARCGETMQKLAEQYVVDVQGNRVSVLLSMEEYRALLDAAEELEAIKAYDAAKAADDEVIPFEQAIAEIERDRR
jgi:hypothetical protein